MTWDNQARAAPGDAPRPAGHREHLVAAAILFSLGAAMGLLITGRYVFSGARAFPAVAVIGVVTWTALGAGYWWVLARVPYFAAIARMPRWLSLMWGALVATSVALVIEEAWRPLLISASPVAGGIAMASVFAVTEEAAKTVGIAAVFLLIQRPRTLVEGLVLGATVGLGFEVVEDLIFTFRMAWITGDGGVAGVVPTLAQRAVLSLTSHWLYSAIAGVGLAYAMCARWAGSLWRITVPIGCFALATALHAAWDMPLALLARTEGGQGALLWSKDIALTVAAAAIVVALLRWSRSREGEYYVTFLLRQGARFIPAELLHALPHGGSRRRARREAAVSAPTRGKRRAIRNEVASAQKSAANAAAVAAQKGDVAAAEEEIRHRLPGLSDGSAHVD